MYPAVMPNAITRFAGQNGAGRGCLLAQVQYPQGPSVIVTPGEKVPFTLVQVAVFLAVARTGGPTSAAQALNISQPAVSKSVGGLEQVSLHTRQWL